MLAQQNIIAVEASGLKLRLIKDYRPLLQNQAISFKLDYEKDIDRRVYQGGFKIWQASYDTLQFVEKFAFQGKKVLDLGCGCGMLGIFALLRGASHVVFNDYNKQVLSLMTAKNIELNMADWRGKCELVGGDWLQLLQREVQFDFILSSEVIYREQNYEPLVRIAEGCLKRGGLFVSGNKQFYFGVGGSSSEFKERVSQSPKLGLKESRTVRGQGGGNKREVLVIERL